MTSGRAGSEGRPYPPPPRAEHHWPPLLTIVAAIVLQVLLPERLTAGPTWLVPAFEGALLIVLVFVAPGMIEREHPVRRAAALGVTALVSAANIYSLVELAHYLLNNNPAHGKQLIGSGVLIWLTNLLIFGLWYWEVDRGGPGRRAAAQDTAPDFLFPQMSDDRIEPRGWRPGFVDYLYVSLTNATAFSPTDTMPLTQRAKGVMGLQALVSLVTLGLVIARAVNILGG